MPTTPEEALRKRQKRTWQRVKSGLQKPLVNGQRIRFLTLTESLDALGMGLDICTSFRKLKERLRRRKLLGGYIKVVERGAKTGMRHLHVVWRGSYQSQLILSMLWWEIHHSPVVDIRAWSGKKSKAANYLSKYLTKANDGNVSWSWGWLWPGFAQDWRNLKKSMLARGQDMASVIGVWERVIGVVGRWGLDKPPPPLLVLRKQAAVGVLG